MSTLEDKLNKHFDETDKKAREVEAQRGAEERKKQEHKAKFYAVVTESVDDFPHLARKYSTATIGIEIYKGKFFGLGKKQRVRIQAWEMPAGIHLDSKGTFYRYDHYISDRYGARPGCIYEECTREEAIDIICSKYCTLGLSDFYDPYKAPQAIKEYVQNDFVEHLTIKKTPDGHLYHG